MGNKNAMASASATGLTSLGRLTGFAIHYHEKMGPRNISRIILHLVQKTVHVRCVAGRPGSPNSRLVGSRDNRYHGQHRTQRCGDHPAQVVA